MQEIKILSTRKLENSGFLQSANNRFALTETDFISIQHTFTVENLQEVCKLTVNEKIPLVFTSANAVVAFHTKFLKSSISAGHFNIFCLSGKTKQQVLQSLNATIKGDAANSKLLAEKIIHSDIRKIIFLCSHIRRDELPVLLEENNIHVKQYIAYKTNLNAKVIYEMHHGVLFFSPSAVTSFFSKNKLQPGITCFAIGSTTAKAIRNYTNNEIIVSKLPSEGALIDAVKTYYHNHNILNESI